MQTAGVQKGRQEDIAWAEAFTQVVRYCAENDEQITITDLCEKLKEYLNGDMPYKEKYVKMKLESHFGEDVILTGIRGKRNVVTSSSWTQFIGSNMDHQVRTLDDAGTFHWDGHSELWMELEHSMGWALSARQLLAQNIAEKSLQH